MGVKLGDRVKDKISGMTGIVTGASEFLYGCRRIGIQAETTKDGVPPDSVWIDEPQADVVEAGVIASFDAAMPPLARRAGPRADAQRQPDPRR